MAPAAESPFCATCQRNQMIVHNIMAEYIPDEDDPEYKLKVANEKNFRAEKERLYPPICANCEPIVHEQMRAADYTAKSDQMRRKLEHSKKNRMRLSTRRYDWTLRLVRLAKLLYAFSLLVGSVWHFLGTIASPGLTDQDELGWESCVGQVVSLRRADPVCFNAAPVRTIVAWSLVADFLTVLWNPKLKDMINRPGGRMRGLLPLWLARIFVFVLRVASLFYRRDVPTTKEDLRFFRNEHAIMLGLVLMTALMTWRGVRLEYQSTASFMQPLDPYLPTAPRDSGQLLDTPPRLNSKFDSFDTMGQSFGSTINMLGDNDEPNLPPSPVTTDSSASKDSDMFSPNITGKKKKVIEVDDMDWTPTQKKFGKQPINIEAQAFGKTPTQSQPQPQPRRPHSLFPERDPNPFAHPVPAFPQNQVRRKLDPWGPSVWNPALPVAKDLHLKKVMAQGASPETRQQMQEGGVFVPKNVKKDAEIFQKPQLKYDYYGYTSQKTTGLEDTFNSLFSK